MKQSSLQPAKGAATIHNDDDPSVTNNDDALQDTDLLTPTETSQNTPPPAYGEIHNEKDGLDTRANVADDGRVNIRINQLNRRLSKIFVPALREQTQESDQDSQPPPPPYIPPSLGSAAGVPPPPMNIVMHVVGSRGDVQPFIALGKVLKTTYGHRVRLATHNTFRKFVLEHGLEFFNIGGDPSQLMAFMVKNPGLMPGFRSMLNGEVSQQRRDVAEYIQGCWRSCYQADDGSNVDSSGNDISETAERPSNTTSNISRPFVADCIIANPPSFAHIHCAEKLGIPLHIMFTMPYSPTQAFPHPLANIQSSNANPQLTNYLSYTMIEILSWQGLGDIINRFRARCLGLDPISAVWGTATLQRLKIPHLYCWSPVLISKPKDWGSHLSVSGYCFLDSKSDYIPPSDLREFLDAGPAPIYIGFGSIVLDDPKKMLDLILQATRSINQRVLLSTGWSGLGVDESSIPDTVFVVGNVPHDWLFKHVSCVVHHGGAGTTATGIAQGRPTVIVPLFGDQYFWGDMVALAGAGPEPIPHKQLTADKLAKAIDLCLMSETLERARALSVAIAAEEGNHVTAQSFHQHLRVDRLRCMLVPSRTAVWRLKHTRLRLCAFAASTLVNAKVLDFQDLKLFRPCEHYTDDGPVDPISGGTMAFVETFGNMLGGLVDFPSETWKALQISTGTGRKSSRPSKSTTPRNSTAATSKLELPPRASLGQSQTSSSVPLDLSRASSGSSDIPSHHLSYTSGGHPDVRTRNAIAEDTLTQSSSKPNINHDKLRPTGAHTSKGLGRIVKAIVQGPMDISVSMTRGLHNVPKLLGDDTVRPQEQIRDFKSGAKAAGKEFGLGMYDGITGLVTQPWRGARKEGAIGLLKGIGKGVGGLVAKPSAGMLGVPGYMMKGVHKEVQKLLGGNVQTYIHASRAAEGYEEWMQSSDEEQQHVIVRWEQMKDHLKAKGDAEGMMQDFLIAQQKKYTGERPAHQHFEDQAGLTHPFQATDNQTEAFENVKPLVDESQNSKHAMRMPQGASSEAARIRETVPSQVQAAPSKESKEDGCGTDEPNLNMAIAESKTEEHRHAEEARHYAEELRLAMAQSLAEQGQSRGGIHPKWQTSVDLEEDDANSWETKDLERIGLKIESSNVQSSAVYDPGHLAGMSQSEFVEQCQRRQGEKTLQEKTEEEIVMNYMKNQSLLEMHHQDKGKGRATETGI